MEPMRVYLLHNDTDAEQHLRPTVTQLEGTLIRTASAGAFLEEVRSQPDPACLVTSVIPRRECAIDFLPAIKRQCPDVPVIVWSADLDVATGVELMRLGAHSVIEYPGSQHTLLLSLHQAMHESEGARSRSLRENQLRDKLGELSPGEQEVMRLLFDGMTNKEIASRLAVSRRTVETRRQRIVKLAGVSNLIELVVLLAEHGMLSDTRAEGAPAVSSRR
jgi:RNA polymerase sigma factor (sigma-70 family)